LAHAIGTGLPSSTPPGTPLPSAPTWLSDDPKATELPPLLNWKRGAIMLVAFLIVIGAVMVIHHKAIEAVRQEVRGKVRDLATLLAGQVDADALRQFDSPDDMAEPSFARTMSLFQAAKSSTPDVTEVYAFRPNPDPQPTEESEDLWIFMADARPVDTDENGDGKIGENEQGAAPGDHYDYHTPAMTEAMERPVAEEDYYTDNWGTFLSGYAPIVDPNTGVSIGILGVDIRREAMMDKYQGIAVACITLGLVLSALVGMTLLSVFGRDRNLAVVAQLDAKVHDHNKDLTEANLKLLQTNALLHDTNKQLDESNRKMQESNRMMEEANAKLGVVNARLEEANRKIGNSHKQLEDTVGELRERERIMADELKLAEEVQQRFLPHQFPFPERLRFAGMYRACSTIGGDLYDAFTLDDHTAGFYIADVSGHGVSSALVTAVLKVTVERFRQAMAEAMAPVDPNDVSSLSALETEELRIPNSAVTKFVEELNRAMCQTLVSNTFVTLMFGTIDLRTGDLRIVNAGHNPPILWDGETHTTRVLGVPSNLPLGLDSDFEFRLHKEKIQPGDKFILYTDGIPERQNSDDEMFGLERLVVAVETNGDFLPHLLQNAIDAACNDFGGEVDAQDDQALLVIEWMSLQEQGLAGVSPRFAFTHSEVFKVRPSNMGLRASVPDQAMQPGDSQPIQELTERGEPTEDLPRTDS